MPLLHSICYNLVECSYSMVDDPTVKHLLRPTALATPAPAPATVAAAAAAAFARMAAVLSFAHVQLLKMAG